MLEVDVKKVFEDIGGVMMFVRLMNHTGRKIHFTTAYKWIHRNNIPTKWLLVIVFEFKIDLQRYVSYKKS